jgi:energy-coupling factor transporter ATP-binding protein EcfA2
MFSPMDHQTAQLDLLIDLEARHEDLLVRLDELDKRVEQTLAECQRYRVVPRVSPQNLAFPQRQAGSERPKAERSD